MSCKYEPFSLQVSFLRVFLRQRLQFIISKVSSCRLIIIFITIIIIIMIMTMIMIIIMIIIISSWLTVPEQTHA